MIDAGDITGIVLCGGQARRMAGIEKPLQFLHERPLVAHVVERLRPQVGAILISANREMPVYAAIGHQVINDLTTGLGPLGGLQAALVLVRTPWFFCCPGDAPFLDRRIIARLGAVANAAPSKKLVVPSDGERSQHLFVLGAASLRIPLDNYLASGRRSVREFIDTNAGQVVTLPDLTASFRNINSMEDLERARQELPL